MTGLKITGRCLVVLLASASLWAGASYAQNPGTPKFKEEVSKQDGIYQSRGVTVPEGYVIDRSLLSYTFTLPAEFSNSLANLGPADRWLDIGAGEGRAICDYATGQYDALHFKGRERPEKRARAVAISIEDRRSVHWYQTAESLEENQIQYLFGKRLRQYSSEELGKFQLITDLLGGFSYTENLSQYMEKTLGVLEAGGNFYTLLQDVRAEQGTNRPFYPGSPFLTEITDADGTELKVCSWLKRISCVEVTCEFKSKDTPPTEVYRIHKVCDGVIVPPLAPSRFVMGTPPERRFRSGNPPPASPGRASSAR